MNRLELGKGSISIFLCQVILSRVTYNSFLCFYSIRYVLAQIDTAIQYGEDADVKVKDFDPEDDD